MQQNCANKFKIYFAFKIEEMLDEGTTQVFNECILAQTELTRQQLSDLQERHKDLQQ